MGDLNTRFVDRWEEAQAAIAELEARDQYDSEVLQPELEALGAQIEEYEDKIEFLESVLEEVMDGQTHSITWYLESPKVDLWRKYYSDWLV